MWQTLFSGAMKLRFIVWVLQQMLPSGSELKLRFKSGLLGCIAMFAAACFVLAAIMLVMMGVGYYLYSSGAASMAGAAFIVLGSFILIALICIHYGKQQFQQAFHHHEAQAHLHQHPAGQKDIFSDILDGFLAGWQTGNVTPPDEVAPDMYDDTKKPPKAR